MAQQDKVADREPERLAPFAVRPSHRQHRQKQRQQTREIRRQKERNKQQTRRPTNAPLRLVDHEPRYGANLPSILKLSHKPVPDALIMHSGLGTRRPQIRPIALARISVFIGGPLSRPPTPINTLPICIIQRINRLRGGTEIFGARETQIFGRTRPRRVDMAGAQPIDDWTLCKALFEGTCIRWMEHGSFWWK